MYFMMRLSEDTRLGMEKGGEIWYNNICDAEQYLKIKEWRMLKNRDGVKRTNRNVRSKKE